MASSSAGAADSTGTITRRRKAGGRPRLRPVPPTPRSAEKRRTSRTSRPDAPAAARSRGPRLRRAGPSSAATQAPAGGGAQRSFPGGGLQGGGRAAVGAHRAAVGVGQQNDRLAEGLVVDHAGGEQLFERVGALVPAAQAQHEDLFLGRQGARSPEAPERRRRGGRGRPCRACSRSRARAPPRAAGGRAPSLGSPDAGAASPPRWCAPAAGAAGRCRGRPAAPAPARRAGCSTGETAVAVEHQLVAAVEQARGAEAVRRGRPGRRWRRRRRRRTGCSS